MDRLSRNGPVRPSIGNAGADEARQPNPQTNTRRSVRRLNPTTTMNENKTFDRFCWWVIALAAAYFTIRIFVG